MWLIIQFVVQLVLYFVLAASQKTKKPDAAKLEDLSIPEVSETKSIAIGYGTYKQQSPNLIWYGNLSNRAIKVDGGLFGSDQTVGYKYYLSLCFGLAHGDVNLRKLLMDDKVVYENKNLINGEYTDSFSNKDFFSKDNGISFVFDYYSGTDTQLVNSHLNTDNGLDFPRMKNVSYIVLRGNNGKGGWIGNQLALKNLALVCERLPNFPEITQTNGIWGGDAFDSNPIHIIFDILTNKKYGLGLSTELLDLPSFNAAAVTLNEEKLGLSLIYEDKFRANDFINEILRHVSGSLVEDPTTGLIEIKLIRQDYVFDDLPILNEDNVVSVSKFQRTTNSDLFNEVKVEFTRRLNNFQSSIAQFQNLGLDFDDRANANQSTNLSFPFITTAENANKIAFREGLPLTTNLASIQLKTQRIQGLEVGDVFRFQWEQYGIQDIVFRIQQINYGNLSSNSMTVDAVQDSFGVDFSSYTPPPESDFEDIDYDATPVDLKLLETPYFINNEYNGLIFFANQNNSINLSYKVFGKESGELNFKEISEDLIFSTTFQLVNAVDCESVSFIVDFDDEEDFTAANEFEKDQGKNLCVITDGIDYEFISFTEFLNNNTLTNVRRGCLDTQPKNWLANAFIYFIDGNNISINSDFTINEEVDLKAISSTDRSTLELADAPTVDYTFSNAERRLRPIIPADVKANNQNALKDVLIGQVDLDLSWGFRNLVNQNIVRDYYNAVEGSNIAGVNYNIKIFDDTDTLIKEVNTTTNTYTFDDETTINPSGLYYPSLRVEIISQLNGYDSLETININVSRS